MNSQTRLPDLSKLKIISFKLFLFVLFSFSVFLNIENWKKCQPTENKDVAKQTRQKELTIEHRQIPILDLPLEYFSNKNVMWGIVKDRNDKSINGYKTVALNNKVVYQSYPTTAITIRHYFNKKTSVKNKNYSKIKKNARNSMGDHFQAWWKIIDKNYKKYGDTALYFFEKSLIIERSDKFDVDGDGSEELIVEVNGIGRADGGSYQSVIIKNENVVFWVEEDNSRIVPAETNNGFYIEQRIPQDNSPRCCESGRLRTRFVYRDGKFLPVFQQEIKYVMVGREKD